MEWDNSAVTKIFPATHFQARKAIKFGSVRLSLDRKKPNSLPFQLANILSLADDRFRLRESEVQLSGSQLERLLLERLLHRRAEQLRQARLRLAAQEERLERAEESLREWERLPGSMQFRAVGRAVARMNERGGESLAVAVDGSRWLLSWICQVGFWCVPTRGGFLKIFWFGILTYAGMKTGFHADVSPSYMPA